MKKILLLAFTASVMLGACKKSDDAKEETISCQMTEKNSLNGKVTYTYNSEGKLVTVIDDVYQETYDYTSTSIVWKFIEPSGSTSTTTYLLDAQGRVKSSSDGTNNNTFSFDSEGYLIEVTSDASWIGTIKYTWINGNLTKVERTTIHGTNTINLEYGTESRPSNFNGDISNNIDAVYWHDGDRHILTSNYFGKQSKNLVSKVISDGNTSTQKYIRDANSNVINTEIIGGHNVSSEYKYNCK